MERIPFVHISDLHFSGRYSNNRFGPVSGYHAHDPTLCNGLQIAFRQIPALLRMQPGEKLRAVCSGDLTASGRDEEFIIANTYLRSKLRIRYRSPVTGGPGEAGLSLDDDDFCAVAGNHDHWNGNNFINLFSASIAHVHVEIPPWRRLWRSPGGGLELELFGLDTTLDNGRAPIIKGRILAQGNLSQSQLNALDNLIANNPMPPPSNGGPRRVRAIVMHHSPSYGGGQNAHTPMSKMILPTQYRQALFNLATKHRISVLLTGHTHDPYHGTFHLGHGLPPIHELRCASTLQGPVSSNPAKSSDAGFLLHSLSFDGTQVTWNSVRYRWINGRFLPPLSRSFWASFTVP